MDEWIIETKRKSRGKWHYIDTFRNRELAKRYLKTIREMWKQTPPSDPCQARMRKAPARAAA